MCANRSGKYKSRKSREVTGFMKQSSAFIGVTEIGKCLEQVEGPADPGNCSEKAEENFEPIENETFFLAASPAMQKIRNQAEHVAKVDIPVLILGESGAGKEVLARLIHKLSARSRKPMVKVN